MQHYSAQISLLRDLVNYGSQLIPKAFEPSGTKLENVIVLGVLLKNVVIMIDGVEIIVSNGTVYPALLQARAAFETSIYLDWLVLNQTEKKANYYYVSSLRNERIWALRVAKDTPAHRKFISDTQSLKDYLNLETTEMFETAEKHLIEVNRILSQSNFKQIDSEFELLKKGDRTEPAWYIPLLGKQSGRGLRAIAQEVGRVAEYVFFYEQTSRVTHASSYKDHIKFRQNTFLFEPIRWLNGIDTLIRFTGSIALHTYRTIIEKYSPNEMANFHQRYVTEWRQPFLNIPSIEYMFGSNI
jgi:hypothetical protein